MPKGIFKIYQAGLIAAVLLELDRQGADSITQSAFNVVVRCVDEIITECEKDNDSDAVSSGDVTV